MRTENVYVKCIGIYNGVWTRTSPNYQATKVEFIEKDQEIIIYFEIYNHKWYKIYGKNTYIPIEFKDINGSITISNDKYAKYAKCKLNNVFITNKKINVYAKPSIKSKVLYQLNNNEVVLLYNNSIKYKSQCWYKVLLSEGFIQESYSTPDEEFSVNFTFSLVESIDDLLSDSSDLSDVIKEQSQIVTIQSINTKRKTIPKKIKEIVWEQYFGNIVAKALCPVCGTTEIKNTSYHCSHIISVANGGTDTPDNLMPLCAGCNLSMSSQNMHDYIKQFVLAIE